MNAKQIAASKDPEQKQKKDQTGKRPGKAGKATKQKTQGRKGSEKE